MSLTEADSFYNNVDLMSVNQILNSINIEDKSVPIIVEKAIPQIERLVIEVVIKLKGAGRLFYIGAGTSGRLGILDASECPPTFGIDANKVVGLIAGGDNAIRNAVEFAEDDINQGWADLQNYNVNENDVVIGIAASGRTPYVLGAVKKCNENNILTGCITCNKDSELAALVKYPIEVFVGPEFLTGSTRMKSGTAQKLILNMISTSVMIQLGRVKGNKMIDMRLSNNKLVDRGTKIIMKNTSIENYDEAKDLLLKYGSVRKAIEFYNSKL